MCALHVPVAGPDQSHLRALVRDPGPVASCHCALDVLGEEARRLRLRRLDELLESAGAPSAAVAGVHDAVARQPEKPGSVRVLVAADGTELLVRRVDSVVDDDVAAFAAPAPLVPLLAEDQARPPFVLAVLDRTGADLTSSPGGAAVPHTWRVEGPDDEIERNAPGGWSQPRYRRRAEDSWRHNAAAVADELRLAMSKVEAQVLVLSGDIRARQLLTERLELAPDVLLRRLSGGRSPDGSQAGRAAQLHAVLADAAAEQTDRLVRHLRDRLDSAGDAVVGWPETIEALARGRVETLLVVPGSAPGRTVWFGAGGVEVYEDRERAASVGRPVEAGDAVDVVVRSALLSGASVRVVPDGSEPGLPEGVGAVCRFGLP
jgi:hypothetical protein